MCSSINSIFRLTLFCRIFRGCKVFSHCLQVYLLNSLRTLLKFDWVRFHLDGIILKRDRFGVKGEMPPSSFASPTSAEVGRYITGRSRRRGKRTRLPLQKSRFLFRRHNLPPLLCTIYYILHNKSVRL